VLLRIAGASELAKVVTYFFFTTAFTNFSIMAGASWPVAALTFSRVRPEI
jgi:hypothetical protein